MQLSPLLFRKTRIKIVKDVEVSLLQDDTGERNNNYHTIPHNLSSPHSCTVPSLSAHICVISPVGTAPALHPLFGRLIRTVVE